YGPFGLLQTVTDPLGNVTSFGYDAIGRRISLADPDTGGTKVFGTAYNAFDEPASEVDPAQQVTTFDYDTLGRLMTRAAPDGNDSFAWDSTAVGSKGRLHSRQRGDISTTYTYDSFGKVANEQWTIKGTTYNYDYAYDGAGRLKTVLYPTVPNRARF